MRYLIALLIILTSAGCLVAFTDQLSHVGTPADPNDPQQAGLLTAEVLRRNLAGASDSFQERVRKGEMSDQDFHDQIARAADHLLNQANTKHINPAEAWQFGELYIAARRWGDAKRMYDIAVKVAKTEDRRVNDNLRLARVMANLNDVKGAVKVARSTFDTPDQGAAPILPATLLEIVPAGQGKYDDDELAALLEDAIKCEARTIVDPKTAAGRDFLAARPHHISSAWRMVVGLYDSAGRPDEARAAEARAEKMLSEQAGA